VLNFIVQLDVYESHCLVLRGEWCNPATTSLFRHRIAI